MRHRTALALLLLVAPLPGAESARVETVTSPAVADTLVGTVRGVYPETRTVQVITGVGLAIRVEPILVYPGIAVRIDGARAPLQALVPGQIVRVAYRVTAEGKVAEWIETVPTPAEGGAP